MDEGHKPTEMSEGIHNKSAENEKKKHSENISH